MHHTARMSQDVPSSDFGLLLVSELCATIAGHFVPAHGPVPAGLCVPKSAEIACELQINFRSCLC